MLTLTLVWFAASSWAGAVIQRLIDDWNRIHGRDNEGRKPRAPKAPPLYPAIALAGTSDPDPMPWRVGASDPEPQPWRAGASDPQPQPWRIVLRGLAFVAGVAAGTAVIGVRTRPLLATGLAAAGLIAFGVSFAVGSVLGLVRGAKAAPVSNAAPAISR
jgi:small-conductance mechanosensitive channel